jgi:thiol-disulfide isomerase/thioredoxin
MMRALRAIAPLVVLLAVAAGCTEPAEPTPEAAPASPFQTCPETAGSGPAGPDNTPAQGDPLPPLTLPCFTGGAPVALTELGKPAVINLWASYCAPCRTELPQLQAFADETAGRVQVLGVVTGDAWSRAAYAGADFGVRFPSVFDPDRQLLRALGRNALPVTLFVAGDGSVRMVDMTGALTLDKLRGLARDHLGVST